MPTFILFKGGNKVEEVVGASAGKLNVNPFLCNLVSFFHDYTNPYFFQDLIAKGNSLI